MNMEFEWDEAKRRSNLEKHGVDFIDAALVLANAPLILEDTRRDYGEQRCLALGEKKRSALCGSVHPARWSVPHHFRPPCQCQRKEKL